MLGPREGLGSGSLSLLCSGPSSEIRFLTVVCSTGSLFCIWFQTINGSTSSYCWVRKLRKSMILTISGIFPAREESCLSRRFNASPILSKLRSIILGLVVIFPGFKVKSRGVSGYPFTSTLNILEQSQGFIHQRPPRGPRRSISSDRDCGWYRNGQDQPFDLGAPRGP